MFPFLCIGNCNVHFPMHTPANSSSMSTNINLTTLRENYEPNWAKGEKICSGQQMDRRTKDESLYFARRAWPFYLLDHKHVYIFHYIPQFV